MVGPDSVEPWMVRPDSGSTESRSTEKLSLLARGTARGQRPLWLPEIPAAYAVFHKGAMRDSAQVVYLVWRIGALIKAGRFGSAAERKTTPRLWPVTHRLSFIDGRTDEGAGVRANNGAHDCSRHIAGGGGAENRTRGGTPASAFSGGCVAGGNREGNQEQS